ncbi:MAG: dicarboxylate/amino acid:cation symporter [Phycisphaerales bacterium]|nr:MAG: dicarboxylate/amino acid:cation symporter [Phycisphaerales bacterium]
MKRLLRWYLERPLVLRIIVCFAVGSLIGGLLWHISQQASAAEPTHPTAVEAKIIPCIRPFGQVFVHMLKMIVVPIIFFSLVVGASSLPIRRFGRIGVKVIGWYLFCSMLAAVLGTFIALAISPGSATDLAGWQSLAGANQEQADELTRQAETEGTLAQLLLNLFRNPFEALATGNFLPIIVFSILFGLAMRVLAEAGEQQQISQMKTLGRLLEACRDTMFKLVDWILEYSPIGVLALTIVNFGLYGPSIVGPYISVTAGVVLGIVVMVFAVYPTLLWVVTRQNPLRVLRRIREPMIMAFVTRSSAATLPVSIKTAEEDLKIHDELVSFSLPLGATINMDGVCVHLPMFAVLAANIFGIQLTRASLVVLVITTVLSSIGAGGVPGGSLMLLFIILETMGLGPEQVTVIVALALGINPILDMFETMNNITGDLVCSYAVAANEGLVDVPADKSEPSPPPPAP